MGRPQSAAFALLLMLLLGPMAAVIPSGVVALREPTLPMNSGGAAVSIDEVPTWRVGDTWTYETGFDVATLIANAGVSASVSALTGDTEMTVDAIGLRTLNDQAGTSVVGYTLDIYGEFTSGNSGATLQGTTGRLDITYSGTEVFRASDMASITSEFDLLVEFAPFNLGFLSFEVADLTFSTTYDPAQESRDHPVRTGDNWSHAYTAETTVSGSSDFFDPSAFDTTTEENTTWAVTGTGAPAAQDGYSVSYSGCSNSWKINRWNTTGTPTGFEWYCPAVRGPAWIRVQQSAGFQIDWTLKSYEPAASYGVSSTSDPGERCTELVLSTPYPAYLPSSTVDLTVEYVVTPAAASACSSADLQRYGTAYTEYLAGGSTGSLNFNTSSSAGTTESRWSAINCCTYTVPETTDGSPANDDHSSDGIVVFDSQNGVVGVRTVVVDLNIVGVDLLPLRDGVLVDRTRDGIVTRLGPGDVLGGIVGDRLEMTVPIANRGILDVTGTTAIATGTWNGSQSSGPGTALPPIGGYGQTTLTVTFDLTQADRGLADPAVKVQTDAAAAGASDANASNDVLWIPVFVGTLPTADLLLDQGKYTAEAVMLNASGSFDEDGGSVTCFFAIQTPDGMLYDVESEDCTLTYTWDDDGLWDISVLVVDEEGDTATATGIVEVLNRPPSVNITGPTEVEARSGVTVEVTDAFDPDTVSPPALAIEYAWSGVTCDEGPSTKRCTFAPSDEGVATAILTATDDDGDSTVVQHNVTSTNIAPSLDAVRFLLNGTEIPPEDGWVVDEDQTVNLIVNADDTPSDLASLAVLWDLSDLVDEAEEGTVGPVSTIEASWPVEGVHRVEVVAIDNDGVRSSVRAIDVTVRNVPPTIDGLDPTVAVYEDDVLRLGVNVDDTPSDLLNLSVCWDLNALLDIDNDGDARNDCEVEGVTLETVWSTQGMRTVTAMVIDDDGASASISTNVTVVNLRPTAAITTEANLSAMVEGDEVNLSSATSLDSLSDLISLRPFWDVPDELLATGTDQTVLNLRALPVGTWTVNLTMTDDDGASHTVMVSITVAEAPPSNLFARAVDTVGFLPTVVIGVLLVVIAGLGAALFLGGRGGSSVVDKSTSIWDQATFEAPPPLAAVAPAPAFAVPPQPAPAPLGAPQAPLPAAQPAPVDSFAPVVEPPVNTGPPLPASGLPAGWTMEQWSFYGERWLETQAPVTPTLAQNELADLLDDLDL